MVRVLASHQCGPGSTPGPGVMCGLSLLLVLERFFSGYSSFPLYSKTNMSKFQFDLGDLCPQLAFCAKYRRHLNEVICLHCIYLFINEGLWYFHPSYGSNSGEITAKSQIKILTATQSTFWSCRVSSRL